MPPSPVGRPNTCLWPVFGPLATRSGPATVLDGPEKGPLPDRKRVRKGPKSETLWDVRPTSRGAGPAGVRHPTEPDPYFEVDTADASADASTEGAPCVGVRWTRGQRCAMASQNSQMHLRGRVPVAAALKQEGANVVWQCPVPATGAEEEEGEDEAKMGAGPRAAAAATGAGVRLASRHMHRLGRGDSGHDLPMDVQGTQSPPTSPLHSSRPLAPFAVARPCRTTATSCCHGCCDHPHILGPRMCITPLSHLKENHYRALFFFLHEIYSDQAPPRKEKQNEHQQSKIKSCPQDEHREANKNEGDVVSRARWPIVEGSRGRVIPVIVGA